MEGEPYGQNKQPSAADETATGDAPNSRNRGDVDSQHASISEQAFVDRIKISDRWMIALTGAIVATGIISAVIFWYQLGAMQSQLNEMRDEQRPWVRVVPQIKGALTNNDGEINLVTEFAVKNLGHTPATSVIGKAEISAGSRIFKNKETSEEEIIALCNERIDPFWAIFGREPGDDVIFPESEGIIDVIATQKQHDDEVFIKKLMVPEDQSKEVKIGGGSLGLVFCVGYKWVGDTVTHHTGGALSVSIPPGIDAIRNGQSVPASSLKLERAAWPLFAGGNYAD